MAHQFVMEPDKQQDAVNLTNKTEIALGDLDGFLVAALCVLRMEEEGDISEDDKTGALETLLKYARSSLFDADEGHKGLWAFTSEYVFATELAQPEAESEQPDQPE